MEINNLLDLILYFIFTVMVLVGALPIGILCIISGLKLLRKYGFKELPENVSGRAYGKKPLEVLVVGLFALVVSFWYLLIDNGGNLFNFWSELIKLTSQKGQ